LLCCNIDKKGKDRKEKKRKEKKRKEKKRKEKTVQFGVNLMRSQVLYRAAQVCCKIGLVK